MKNLFVFSVALLFPILSSLSQVTAEKYIDFIPI